MCRLLSWFLLIASVATVVRAEDRLGRTAAVTKEAELRIEDRVVQKLKVGERVVIKKEQGEWSWVSTASGVAGWINSGNVSIIPGTEPSEDTPAAVEDDRLLLIGVVSTSYLYTTYAYLGTTADGVRHKIYTAEEVQQRVAEVQKMTDGVASRRKKLKTDDLAAPDRAALDRMQKSLSLIKVQATALSEFARSGSSESDQAYQNAATKSWQSLSVTLGNKE